MRKATNVTDKTDPYSMAAAKRDRAEGAIRRISLERAAAVAVGNAALAGRLAFQSSFVYKPMLEEAMEELDAHRPSLKALANRSAA